MLIAPSLVAFRPCREVRLPSGKSKSLEQEKKDSWKCQLKSRQLFRHLGKGGGLVSEVEHGMGTMIGPWLGHDTKARVETRFYSGSNPFHSFQTLSSPNVQGQ